MPAVKRRRLAEERALGARRTRVPGTSGRATAAVGALSSRTAGPLAGHRGLLGVSARAAVGVVGGDRRLAPVAELDHLRSLLMPALPAQSSPVRRRRRRCPAGRRWCPPARCLRGCRPSGRRRRRCRRRRPRPPARAWRCRASRPPRTRHRCCRWTRRDGVEGRQVVSTPGVGVVGRAVARPERHVHDVQVVADVAVLVGVGGPVERLADEVGRAVAAEELQRVQLGAGRRRGRCGSRWPSARCRRGRCTSSRPPDAETRGGAGDVRAVPVAVERLLVRRGVVDTVARA